MATLTLLPTSQFSTMEIWVGWVGWLMIGTRERYVHSPTLLWSVLAVHVADYTLVFHVQKSHSDIAIWCALEPAQHHSHTAHILHFICLLECLITPTLLQVASQVWGRPFVICIKKVSDLMFTPNCSTFEDMASAATNNFNCRDGFIEGVYRCIPCLHQLFYKGIQLTCQKCIQHKQDWPSSCSGVSVSTPPFLWPCFLGTNSFKISESSLLLLLSGCVHGWCHLWNDAAGTPGSTIGVSSESSSMLSGASWWRSGLGWGWWVGCALVGSL